MISLKKAFMLIILSCISWHYTAFAMKEFDEKKIKSNSIKKMVTMTLVEKDGNEYYDVSYCGIEIGTFPKTVIILSDILKGFFIKPSSHRGLNDTDKKTKTSSGVIVGIEFNVFKIILSLLATVSEYKKPKEAKTMLSIKLNSLDNKYNLETLIDASEQLECKKLTRVLKKLQKNAKSPQENIFSMSNNSNTPELIRKNFNNTKKSQKETLTPPKIKKSVSWGKGLGLDERAKRLSMIIEDYDVILLNDNSNNVDPNQNDFIQDKKSTSTPNIKSSPKNKRKITYNLDSVTEMEDDSGKTTNDPNQNDFIQDKKSTSTPNIKFSPENKRKITYNLDSVTEMEDDSGETTNDNYDTINTKRYKKKSTSNPYIFNTNPHDNPLYIFATDTYIDSLNPQIEKLVNVYFSLDGDQGKLEKYIASFPITNQEQLITLKNTTQDLVIYIKHKLEQFDEEGFNKWIDIHKKNFTHQISLVSMTVRFCAAKLFNYTLDDHLDYVDFVNNISSYFKTKCKRKSIFFSKDLLRYTLMLAIFFSPEKITHLDLSSYKLDELPEEIGFLSDNLIWLNLFDNNLTSLPKSICKLKKLDVLCVAQNKLTSLPKKIGSLKNLRMLYFNNNQISSLPPSICSLIKLTDIDGSENALTKLPADFFEKLKNLTIIEFWKNSIQEIPGGQDLLENLEHFGI